MSYTGNFTFPRKVARLHIVRSLTRQSCSQGVKRGFVVLGMLAVLLVSGCTSTTSNTATIKLQVVQNPTAGTAGEIVVTGSGFAGNSHISVSANAFPDASGGLHTYGPFKTTSDAFGSFSGSSGSAREVSIGWQSCVATTIAVPDFEVTIIAVDTDHGDAGTTATIAADSLCQSTVNIPAGVFN